MRVILLLRTHPVYLLKYRKSFLIGENIFVKLTYDQLKCKVKGRLLICLGGSGRKMLIVSETAAREFYLRAQNSRSERESRICARAKYANGFNIPQRGEAARARHGGSRVESRGKNSHERHSQSHSNQTRFPRSIPRTMLYIRWRSSPRSCSIGASERESARTWAETPGSRGASTVRHLK